MYIADGDVEFCEATPIGLDDEPKVSLYGRETDRDLHSACFCFVFVFLRTSSVGVGGEVCCQNFFFCFLFPVQQTTSGIAHRVK